jgi:hypothetical protein
MQTGVWAGVPAETIRQPPRPVNRAPDGRQHSAAHWRDARRVPPTPARGAVLRQGWKPHGRNRCWGLRQPGGGRRTLQGGVAPAGLDLDAGARRETMVAGRARGVRRFSAGKGTSGDLPFRHNFPGRFVEMDLVVHVIDPFERNKMRSASGVWVVLGQNDTVGGFLVIDHANMLTI